MNVFNYKCIDNLYDTLTNVSEIDKNLIIDNVFPFEVSVILVA